MVAKVNHRSWANACSSLVLEVRK